MDVDGLAISGEHRETESDRVERWRIEYALTLGYDTTMALSIAFSDADLHRLEDLIQSGASLEQAARII